MSGEGAELRDPSEAPLEEAAREATGEDAGDDLVFTDHAAAAEPALEPAGVRKDSAAEGGLAEAAAEPDADRQAARTAGPGSDGAAGADDDDPVFREDLEAPRPPATPPAAGGAAQAPPEAVARRGAPPRPGAGGGPGRPPPRPSRAASSRAARPGAASAGGRQRPSGVSSGRHARPGADVDPRTASGKQRQLGGVRWSSRERVRALAARAPDWSRRERSDDEEAAALARLEALVRPAPPEDPFLGQALGPLLPGRFLGVAGGVRSYLATADETGERVHLRVVPTASQEGLHLSAEEVACLRRIAETAEPATRLEHPALPLCPATGRTRQVFYAAQQVPAGRAVADLLAAGDALPESEVLVLLEQVGRALDALHSKRMVHGDVAPHSVWRERPDCFVLSDAGWARTRPELEHLAADGPVLGTPGYVAPEHVDSGLVTPASDLYALGCVAWAALAGRPPFEGDDPGALVLEQVRSPVPPLPTSGRVASQGIATIIANLTGRRTSLRYAAADALLADLEAHARGEPIEPRSLAGGDAPAARPAAPGEMPRAGTLLLALLVLLNVILVGTLGATYVMAERRQLLDPISGYEMPIPGVSAGGFTADDGEGSLEFIRATRPNEADGR